MKQELESAAPRRVRRRSRTYLRMEKTPALQASCLTAGLMTAFALGSSGTAGAQIITSEGNELFGVTFVDHVSEVGYLPYPSPDSNPLSSAPAGAKGIVVLAASPEEYQNYIGSDFQANFGVDESSVLSYLEGNAADVDSYNSFLANLPENFLLNSTYSAPLPLFSYAVLFSGGTGLGTASIPVDSVFLSSNFGAYALALEPAAVTPEPGAVALLLAGGMSLIGHGLARQRSRRRSVH